MCCAPCDEHKPVSHSPDNDEAREWNGIVLLSAIISILIVFIITMIVYSIYFRLYSHRLQRALQRRSRRRAVSAQGYRLSWRGLVDYHFTASPTDGGLRSAVLEALPVFVYKSEDFRDALRCAVCLCEFEENEKGRALPNCGHRFHADCIDMWFYSHSTCPLCREDVEPQADNGHVVVEVSREEDANSNEKVGGDASASAELKDDGSHWVKDVEDESRVDIAVSTLPMER